MHVIVTGNIGCGKSTFLNELAALLPGYKVESVDKMVHSLYEEPLFAQKVQAEFGTTDRAALSDLVFNDPVAKAKLEALSMEFLPRKIREALHHEKVLVEFPMYFELAQFSAENDFVITVSCPPQLQRERLAARSGFSEEKISRILATQYSSQLKEALADMVVDSSTPDSMKKAARRAVANIAVGRLKMRFMRMYQSEELWDILKKAYSEPHRFYHVLNHLAAMFYEYDKVSHKMHYPDAIEHAIWWHDFVYEVDAAKYPQNEARSAKAMWKLIHQYAPQVLVPQESSDYSEVGMAAEFILATNGHRPASPFLLGNQMVLEDCQLFLDIDLAVLGKSEEVADNFDVNIRREFCQYSDQAYAVGRANVLTGFLQRESIFQSPAFKALETQARENLGRMVWKLNDLKGNFHG